MRFAGAASTIRIGLTAAYPDTVHVAIRNPYEHVAYCGKGDPGSTITVAPIRADACSRLQTLKKPPCAPAPSERTLAQAGVRHSCRYLK